MKEGFRWCPHCGKPHGLSDRVCVATGNPLDGTLHRVAPRTNTPAASKASLVGTVLDGKYRILRPIGSGGMGMVFEAENLALNRLVAIKVVIKDDSAEALARLAREARFVAAIQHPNICSVFDVGRLPSGGPYVVLERLFGDTLAAHMTSWCVRPVGEVVDIFLQILAGLHAAHTAQIVHRDLKPQNVFLATRAGCAPIVKIVDFGFAQDLSGFPVERITMPGKSCGTAQYMSPEQVRAERLDHRSDIFAVGVMMYEMLAGRHPFAGASKLDVQVRIIRSDPRPLRQRRPDIPVEVERVVMSALSKNPEQRPWSAFAMQCALFDAMRSLVSSPEVEDEDPPSLTTPIWIPPTSSPPG